MKWLKNFTFFLGFCLCLIGFGMVNGQTLFTDSFEAYVRPPHVPEPAPTFSGEAYFPQQSSQIACADEAITDNIWAVNPENDVVSVVNTHFGPDFQIRYAVSKTIQLRYKKPTSITAVPSGYAVTYRDSHRVIFFDRQGEVVKDLNTGYGTLPVSSVTDGAFLYVALYRVGVALSGSSNHIAGSDYGQIIKIDLNTHNIVARQNVGPTPKGMALRDKRLLVTRFISLPTHAEVYDLNTEDLSLTRTINIHKVLVPDDLDHGSGIPNYLNSVVFSPDGDLAYVAAVKQNIDATILDDDNTVRPMLAVIDLQNHRDLNQDPYTAAGTVDFDNAADPQYVSYLVNGDQIVAFQGNNAVKGTSSTSARTVTFLTGFAPQAMCATRRTLYVKNFASRSISAIDVSRWIHAGNLFASAVDIPLIPPDQDTLSAAELAGLKLFYHSEKPMFGAEGYMSCASCHMDGGHDGQTWNMTAFGEGMRNTLSLNGHSGTRFGKLHWTSNFDEIQDFIFQIKKMNAGTADVPETFNVNRDPLAVTTTGLSAKMDQLAAYVNSLGNDKVLRSPLKHNNNLAIRRGEQIFYDRGCATCHAPPAFTDSQRHDVGTGFAARTPKLIDLADSAPFYHDGRAKTLSDVFLHGAHSGRTLGLSDAERGDLLAYLFALDKGNFISDSETFTGKPSWQGQFGDLVALPPDNAWQTCAETGEICTTPAGATIRYGAPEHYHYRHAQSGAVVCADAVFGDPSTAQAKTCAYVVP